MKLPKRNEHRARAGLKCGRRINQRGVALLRALHCLLALIFGCTSVAAQTPSTEPGKIQQRLEIPSAPVAPPGPIIAPAPRAREKVDPGRPITLTGVVITGATVYSQKELAGIYENYLGRKIRAKDIERILAAITRKYHDDGYILSRAIAPPQRVEFGILRINAIEGYVESVTFSGVVRGRKSLLEAFARRITAQKPLTLSVLERNVLLIDDLPGVTAKPVLRETGDASPRYRMNIDIQDQPFGKFASFDNRGTDDIGPFQVLVGANFNSMLGLYDRTRYRFVTVPGSLDELRYSELQHEEILGSAGTRLLLSGATSDTQTLTRSVVNTGSLIALESRSTRATIGLTHPAIRSRRQSLDLSGEFEFFDSEQKSQENSFEDRLRVVRLGAAYSFTDSLGGTTRLAAVASQGLDILSATKSGSKDLSRMDGRSDFTKLVLNISLNQPLPAGFSVRAAATGQASTATLLSSEEFSVGGARFGRAYDPSEISASDGAAGSLELVFGRGAGKILQKYEIFSFYDFGAVWDTDTGRDSPSAATGETFPRRIGCRLLPVFVPKSPERTGRRACAEAARPAGLGIARNPSRVSRIRAALDGGD